MSLINRDSRVQHCGEKRWSTGGRRGGRPATHLVRGVRWGCGGELRLRGRFGSRQRPATPHAPGATSVSQAPVSRSPQAPSCCRRRVRHTVSPAQGRPPCCATCHGLMAASRRRRLGSPTTATRGASRTRDARGTHVPHDRQGRGRRLLLLGPTVVARAVVRGGGHVPSNKGVDEGVGAVSSRSAREGGCAGSQGATTSPLRQVEWEEAPCAVSERGDELEGAERF